LETSVRLGSSHALKDPSDVAFERQGLSDCFALGIAALALLDRRVWIAVPWRRRSQVADDPGWTLAPASKTGQWPERGSSAAMA
jgi:hypothetical protein